MLMVRVLLTLFYRHCHRRPLVPKLLDATQYMIFLGAQRGANGADSTEILGISVCYLPKQPETFGNGEKKDSRRLFLRLK